MGTYLLLDWGGGVEEVREMTDARAKELNQDLLENEPRLLRWALVEKIPDMAEKTKEWLAGYDCGFNGPNKENCHYSNFGTKEQTEDWEAGKRAGEKERKRGRSVKPNPRKK